MATDDLRNVRGCLGCSKFCRTCTPDKPRTGRCSGYEDLFAWLDGQQRHLQRAAKNTQLALTCGGFACAGLGLYALGHLA